jgi:hypothetical protein
MGFFAMLGLLPVAGLRASARTIPLPLIRSNRIA